MYVGHWMMRLMVVMQMIVVVEMKVVLKKEVGLATHLIMTVKRLLIGVFSASKVLI